MPLSTSRTSTSRRRPPRLAGGIIGATSAHSASLRSLGRQARIWSNGEHTYVVVADRAAPEFEQIAAYLRNEAQ